MVSSTYMFIETYFQVFVRNHVGQRGGFSDPDVESPAFDWPGVDRPALRSAECVLLSKIVPSNYLVNWEEQSLHGR